MLARAAIAAGIIIAVALLAIALTTVECGRVVRRRLKRRRPEGVDGTGAPLDDAELAEFKGILRASGIDDRVYDSRRAA